MKIVITATEPNLDGEVDPKFGRAAHFVFVETDSIDYETMDNPNMDLASGAGIQTARIIVEKGAKVVLTGSCGPNAYEVLEAAGVEVYVGVTGIIPKAIEALKAGELLPTDGPDVEGHNHKPGSVEKQTPTGTASSQSAVQSGRGRGAGRGQGSGRHGRCGGGSGKGGGRRSGVCVCPGCGTIVDHVPGVPCSGMSCPQCGSQMVRE